MNSDWFLGRSVTLHDILLALIALGLALRTLVTYLARKESHSRGHECANCPITQKHATILEGLAGTCGTILGEIQFIKGRLNGRN